MERRLTDQKNSRVYYSDQKSLTYLNKCKNLPLRFLRLAIFLQQFDFEIEYVKGRDNQVADFLSRFSLPELLEKETEHLEVNLIQDTGQLKNIINHFSTAYDPETLSLVNSDREGTRRYTLQDGIIIFTENDRINS